MAVLFGIVALVGVFSWAIVKSDELSGLGRNVVAGSFRHPHGRLVATHCTQRVEPSSYGQRLMRVLPIVTFVVLDVVAIACLVMESNGISAGAIGVNAFMAGIASLPIAAECLLRLPKSSQRFSVFVPVVLAGLVLATACGAFANALSGGGSDMFATASLVIADIAGCALGCALAAAAVREREVFQRRFEDGHESEIAISAHGALHARYRDLMVGKKAWESGRRRD